MSAVIITIADAIVAALNGASLSLSFTAERFYVPVYDLQKDLTVLRVTVVPKTISIVQITRASDDHTYQIDISVQKRIPNDALNNDQIKAACDPLMLLIEQIIDLFRGQTFPMVGGAVCMTQENPMIYIALDLDENRVFSSIATLTFKKVRAES